MNKKKMEERTQLLLVKPENSQGWWPCLLILALMRMRQKEQEFQVGVHKKTLFQTYIQKYL